MTFPRWERIFQERTKAFLRTFKGACCALLVVLSSRVCSCVTAAISPFRILHVAPSQLQSPSSRPRIFPSAQGMRWAKCSSFRAATTALQSLETDLPPKLSISLQCTKAGLLGTGKAEQGEQEDKTFYVEYF